MRGLHFVPAPEGEVCSFYELSLECAGGHARIITQTCTASAVVRVADQAGCPSFWSSCPDESHGAQAIQRTDEHLRIVESIERMRHDHSAASEAEQAALWLERYCPRDLLAE